MNQLGSNKKQTNGRLDYEFDEGDSEDVIYHDFLKACEKVPHQRLRDKLVSRCITDSFQTFF